MGDGGELERALVDVTGTGKRVRSCCEKQFEKKLDCHESIRKQIWPSCRKIFRVRFVFVGFVKATQFRDSSEYSDCDYSVWQGVAFLVKFYT